MIEERSDIMGVGGMGEDIAVNHLKKLGFRIVARNVRYSIGEIDIVARNKEGLHFIEVKTADEDSFVPPLEEITPAKMRKIRQLAEVYIADRRNGLHEEKLPPCHFDVVAVELFHDIPRVECIFDAFE